MANALQVVSDQDAAISMFKSVRLQILQALTEPDSAAGLSRRLGMPRQRINYHLRQLEAAGLVELVEERRKGNCTERVLRASAQGYVVDPAMLGGLDVDPARAGDRLSATYLVSLLARGIREVAKLRRLAADKQKQLPTLALDTEISFGSAAAQAEFAQDLTNAINEVIARHHDETARRRRRFRLLLASYPVPPTENDDD
jgi:DNA-binding transcriptional ArsR family regulator